MNSINIYLYVMMYKSNSICDCVCVCVSNLFKVNKILHLKEKQANTNKILIYFIFNYSRAFFNCL